MYYTIRVDGLTKRFKDVKAVDKVSFEVEHEELFGLLGRIRLGKQPR
jgi:ABC-type uncharacterized transport system ATPase subunit